MLGVVPMTVIGYDKRGIMSFERSATNRRIITKSNLIKYLDSVGLLMDDSNNVRYDAVYGRVSTQKQCQRGDLDNQINTILAYTATRNPVNIHIYKDVGSGLNDNRKELLKLLNDIQQNKINRLFITYKDRLTRFGFNYLNEICKYHNTTIISISNEVIEKSVQEELAEDLCAIIHSFSGKLYGLRKSQLKDINTELNNIKEVNDKNETG
jgi:predicted site-specific integrase-resolvase